MVAQTAEVPHGTTDPDADRWLPDAEKNWHHANRGGLRRLIASSVRLANIQLKIWLTEAKITAANIVFYLAMFGAAAVIGLLAIIFLFIGMFKILTDVIGIPPVWSYLIFGGVLMGIAVALIMVGKNALNKKPDAKTHKPETPARTKG